MRHRLASALLAIYLIFSLFTSTTSHVALTYPPARKYDLDFLDNSRTKAPCGMPKGNTTTSILSGSKFNVSWHLGYPHRGGFKIQLLDHLERPVLDLTPTIKGSEFVSQDATAQTYQVQLPPDYTCNDCTLRLIRQALEWGNNYKFWTCADVDIKAKKDYRETCSGHGRYLLGRCKCDRLYYGNHCQYKDECLEDNDCGIHGKCIDVQATTAPRHQCYCQLGWFGLGCNKQSPVKTMDIDFGLYTERKLSNTFRIFWRILKEHQELEVVMVVNGLGYAGLGWRPLSLKSNCKNFPVIGPPANYLGANATPEPEPISEPEPSAQPNLPNKLDIKSESEPISEPEPKPEPETTSNPEPEPEPTSKAEPELELTTTLKPKYKKSIYSRRSASPSPRVFTSRTNEDIVETSISYKVSSKQGRQKRNSEEYVAEPTSEPEPQHQTGSKINSKSPLKPESDIKSNSTSIKPTSKPEPTAEPKSEPEPTAEPKSEPESTAEPKSEPEPTAEPKSEPEPTTEPKSEPESTFEPKSEPEPTLKPKYESESSTESKSEPEPTAEPKSEPEPSAEPKSEPEPTAEPKSEPEPTAEPKSEPEPSTEPSVNHESIRTKSQFSLVTTQQGNKDESDDILNLYTPRHDFNAMDCTDIIIGSVRNTSIRIADYYTRDRSTPRIDSIWGGKDDLTAALGFEKNGITTIFFRKKLEAAEPSDHSIENNLMHVIWAQGQEVGKYVHNPKSGVETSNVSVKDFYKPDELKYHGHGSQRGKTTINFFDENKTQPSSSEDKQPLEALCNGIWKYPSRCSLKNSTCEYVASWRYYSRNDEILFKIMSKRTNSWTGIAFSNNEKMVHTDAILGWVDKNGRPFLMDTWIRGYTIPVLDTIQSIYNTSGRIVDGVTVLSFVRKRISNDSQDISFTNEKCQYMMFPVNGGGFNDVNKKIYKHEIPPLVSSERICIKSCGNSAFDDLFDGITSTPETPTLDYNLEVKIVNLGENFHAPLFGSLEYDELSNTIVNNFESIFNKLTGYKSLVIQNLKGEQNDIIAKINLQMDKSNLEKARSLEQPNEQEKMLKALLQKSILTGRVGALKVDPGHFVFEADSVTSNIISDESREKDFFNLSGTKLYIVLGCFAALVLLSVVQATCTIYKSSKKSSSNHKDQLLQNSAWKDYSTANTNYAFDTFETEEKPSTNGHSRSGTLPAKSTSSRSGRPTSRPPSIPAYPPSYKADTRSLQRPRSVYQPGQLERSTLSLPRTTYDRHRSPPNMSQPDFYFMPSQRKYSGEVVRVYVDYNSKPK